MNQELHLPKRRRWLRLGLLLGAGAVALPIAGFVAGRLFLGAYAGPYGLLSYLGSVYRALLGAALPAVVMVLAPALVVAVWSGIARIWPRLSNRVAGAGGADPRPVRPGTSPD